MRHIETLKISLSELRRLVAIAESSKISDFNLDLEYSTDLDLNKPPIIAIYPTNEYGNKNLLGFLDIEVVKNNRAGNKLYSLHEAIVDITLQASYRKFISHNSRQLIEHIIEWAKEFEVLNKDVEWGISTELDYIDAIEQFADIKIKEAVELQLGYIDA